MRLALQHSAQSAVALLLLASACGTETGSNSYAGDDPSSSPSLTPVAGPMPTAVPPPTGKVTAFGTVMDRGRPQLCVGSVLASYPPQCGGPPIKGWDWSTVAESDYTREGEIRWGEFVVVGTYDGTSFTLDRATPWEPGTGGVDPEPNQFKTPCPEPDGGWRVIDPARVDRGSLEAVMAKASQLDGYAVAWVDNSRDPRSPEEVDNDAAAGNEDESLTIVNVAVTDDVDAAEEELRDLWGGGLCVSKAEHTDAERQAIADELNHLPGMSSSGSGVMYVDVSVLWDDGSLQAWVDRKYGEGLVRIHSEIHVL
jgi:uncharacterized protein YfkK (UPF0435 family)